MLEEDTVWEHDAAGLSLAWPSAGEDLPAKQIVGYKREPPTIHAIGAIVAVNDTFTCYAIKNGLVRAIHRLSGETALLRGLTTDVIDLHFCPGLDRIVAVTKAGAWYTWDIKLDARSEVQVKEVFFSDRRPPQRPPTHPDAVLLAVIKDDTVVVAHNGLPCHALYFYVGGVLATPAAVKVDSPIRALCASATTGQVLVGCEDGSVTSVSVPGRPGFGRSGSPIRITRGAVTLVAPCANGYLVGGAATAEFHLLSGALQPLASLSLGAPPPSVHDASKPLLMTYEPSSATIVIAASADPSTKGGSSLTFLRLRVPAPSVPETPSFVLAATRVPSERPVLNVACAYNPSEGTLFRRLEALEALTKVQAQTTHQGVSAALSQSMSTLAATLAHAHAQQSDALALRMGVAVGEAVNGAVRTQLPPLLQAETSGVKAIVAEVRTAVQDLSRNLEAQLGQAVSQAATQAAVALGTALEASMLEALEKRIAPRVEAAVTQSLLSLTTTASALPPQVAAAVTASVNARMSATVKEHFEGVLVPGYERASRALFEQLHGTFTQGVSAVVTEASAPFLEMLTTTTAQAAAHQEELMSDVTAKLDAAIKQAAAEITGAARRSAHDAAKATPAVNLSAGLDAEPVKLKLSWLKAAFTLLNPTDPLIAPNIERILTAVRDNLKRAEARVPEGLQTDLAMLLFRVNKLSQARS
ncbi:wd g-beta repeat-containing [Chrysochromulina tobinii]|uniref:Wd g-beta repeat-containing n=1 Tax=Chrysochromulina tobinii TaxID=1460289 RepID=A0A0M0K244_9EUKA|nr:wd g-beta repeat-containing [Chrysochromulina tobinii]|eukprot:KOO32662.1 wd g-beta repeat-containing [Chrysochromulina sp. CCMP291]